MPPVPCWCVTSPKLRAFPPLCRAPLTPVLTFLWPHHRQVSGAYGCLNYTNLHLMIILNVQYIEVAENHKEGIYKIENSLDSIKQPSPTPEPLPNTGPWPVWNWAVEVVCECSPTHHWYGTIPSPHQSAKLERLGTVALKFRKYLVLRLIKQNICLQWYLLVMVKKKGKMEYSNSIIYIKTRWQFDHTIMATISIFDHDPWTLL